jgi:hypothetical protein
MNDPQAAVKGVLGIMKFGKHDSPVLLEVLADLLLVENRLSRDDAKRLATRALLKASYEVKDPDSRAAYRQLAKVALNYQTRAPDNTSQLPLEELEQTFLQELEDARTWYEQLRQDEIGWIRDGKDPEAEFARLYSEEPSVLSAEEDFDGQKNQVQVLPVAPWLRYYRGMFAVVGASLVGVGVVVFVLALRRVGRRRRFDLANLDESRAPVPPATDDGVTRQDNEIAPSKKRF